MKNWIILRVFILWILLLEPGGCFTEGKLQEVYSFFGKPVL